MIYDNTTNRLHKDVIIRITKAFLSGNFDELNLIPIQMRPKDGPFSRCCVYKDRAMLRFRCMGALGISIEDDDELTALSEYAEAAVQRENIQLPVISVIHEGCSACVQSHYQITNACHGCLAKPCIINCPKKAITKKSGKAVIDEDKCINCGRCLKVCPYNAIIYVPIPCQEACPVGALSKNENGIVKIDYKKCIYCGKCVLSCPFGAVVEKSQIIDVLKAISSCKKTVAMLAPAIVGQFKTDLPNITGALKNFGFSDVIEVATGADKTASLESKEFIERMEKKDAFMTSSCCPAYSELARKHITELSDKISTTATPMLYTAQAVKEKYPDAITVFVGPCIAKRMEAIRDKSADYVLTFDELDALLAAKNITPENSTKADLMATGKRQGRGFPVSGGMTKAIQSLSGKKVKMKPILVDGLTSKSVAQLRTYVNEKCPGNFIEVMTCEGGCVAGPATIANPKAAAAKVKKLVDNSSKIQE